MCPSGISNLFKNTKGEKEKRKLEKKQGIKKTIENKVKKNRKNKK